MNAIENNTKYPARDLRIVHRTKKKNELPNENVILANILEYSRSQIIDDDAIAEFKHKHFSKSLFSDSKLPKTGDDGTHKVSSHTISKDIVAKIDALSVALRVNKSVMVDNILEDFFDRNRDVIKAAVKRSSPKF